MKTIELWFKNLGVEFVHVGTYKWDGNYFPQVGDTIAIKNREYKIVERVIDLSRPDHIKVRCE